MITVDYLIIGILVVSMIVGFFRGFFPEVISIASWVIAIFAAMNFSGLIEPYIQGKLGSVVIEQWAAHIIMFVIALILGGLIGQLVSLVIDKSGLSGTDRMLGLVFGIVRGAVIIGVLVMLGQFMGFTKEPWWPQSRLIPVGERVADTLGVLIPDNISQFLQERLSNVEQEAPQSPAEAN